MVNDLPPSKPVKVGDGCPAVMARVPARVYCVPRRYDLWTMLVATLGCSVLFAGMHAMEWPPESAVATGLFFLFVGAGQALLFRGESPRTASVVVGACVGAVAVSLSAGWIIRGPEPLFVIFFSAVGLGIVGYLVGATIGGLFLIADMMRSAMKRDATVERRP